MLEKLPVFFLGFSIPRFLGNPKKKNQTGLKPGNLTWKREFCAEGKAGIPSQTSGLGFIPRIWESLRHMVVPSAWKKFGISRKTPVFSQSQRPGESCGCGRDIPGNPGIPPSQKKMGISPRGIPAGNPIHDFLIPLSPRIPSLSWQFPAGSNLGIHLDIPTWKSSSGGSGNPWKIPGFFSLPEGIRKLFHGFVLFCFFSQVFDALLFSFFPPGCCWWISWSFPGIFLEFSWNSLRAGWPGWWWGRSGPGTGLGGVHPST